MILRRIAFLTISLLTLASALPAKADGTFQAWYQNTIWYRLNPHWSIGNYLDLRVNDAIDDVHTWMVSPRIRYDVNPNLQLQFNTTWVDAFNAENTRLVDSFRLELEANPTFPLTSQLTFSMRNRFEWRWMEGNEDFNTRIRTRPQLEWFVSKTGVFRGFFANYEMIWDFDQERMSETRLVPFGLIFRPTEKLDLRLSYLWRQTVGRAGWYDYHAVVMAATLNF